MIIVKRYRKTRFWAVYDTDELVCVTVYRKGANGVKARLEGTPPVSRTEERQTPSLAD